MVEAEKSSSNALATQVNLLTRLLEEAKATGRATVGMYQVALDGFGGATSPCQLMPPPLAFLLG